MPISKRVIQESPVEIGIEESIPYTLTVPASWGTASSPTVVAKNAQGATIASVVSLVSESNNIISFTVDGTALIVDNDYRLEFKFTVTGGTLEAYGIWQSRL